MIEMDITSVKKVEDDGILISYQLISNGKTYSVPIDTDNRHYQAIQEWVAEGGVIEEADV